MALPFSYQGRLVDGAALANGNYELRFRLFDSVTAGNQVGGNLSLPSVAVTNGLFTVQLDFGNGVFNGASRYLPPAPSVMQIRWRYSIPGSRLLPFRMRSILSLVRVTPAR